VRRWWGRDRRNAAAGVVLSQPSRLAPEVSQQAHRQKRENVPDARAARRCETADPVVAVLPRRSRGLAVTHERIIDWPPFHSCPYWHRSGREPEWKTGTAVVTQPIRTRVPDTAEGRLRPGVAPASVTQAVTCTIQTRLSSLLA
jgi:hypothetical protein